MVFICSKKEINDCGTIFVYKFYTRKVFKHGLNLKRMKFFTFIFPLMMTVALTGMHEPLREDSRAAEILRTYELTFDDMQDFQASFIWEMNDMRRNISQNGTIWYKKGMYLIDLKEQQIFCDLLQQWIYIKAEQEVYVSDYRPNGQVGLESVFSLHKYRSRARYDGQEMVNGQLCHRIFLELDDATVDCQQASLWIDQGSYTLRKAILLSDSQITTTYLFTHITPNTGLGDELFRFNPNKYPGVNVIQE